MIVSELRSRIDSMSPLELDCLPCGIIQLDEHGTILHYNDYEARLADLARESAIGRNFFKDVAPCTDVQEFHGRFRAGVLGKRLDVSFEYHFAFRHAPRDVLITLFYSDATSSVWVLVQPL